MEDLYIKKTQHTSPIHLKALKHPKLRVRSKNRAELEWGWGGLKKKNLNCLFFTSTNKNCLLIVQLINLAAIYLQSKHAIFY